MFRGVVKSRFLKFFLLALGFNMGAVASPMQERGIAPEALKELCQIAGIPQSDDIVADTQKHWLRKPGKERWEITDLAEPKRQGVLKWAKKQGLFAPWKPTAKVYDQALILGAATGRMQMRLNFLIQLWKEGVRFGEVVWLTGERPLDARVDSLLDRCKNESQAARILWQEAALPEGMDKLPVAFISAPMKGEARPNRADTIQAWLKTSPKPCKVLFVSNQPFCGYEFAVVKTTLPNNFLFDVVGPSTPESSQHAAVLLDSIARWIYQEKPRN